MLKRKMWRDIKENYGGYLALISVLVIGLMMYVSLALTLDNLNRSAEDYYRKYNFAQVFISLAKAPETLMSDIEKIPGVSESEGRIMQDVMVNKPSGEEITNLRLVSFRAQEQRINKIRLEKGRFPRAHEGEILLSKLFLEGNGLAIGDKIPIVIFGQEVKLTITGTANSPEFVYEIPDGQNFAPNPKAFGIGFVEYTTMESLFGMESQINDGILTLDPGVAYTDIKINLNSLIERYEGTSLPRKDQLSSFMLTQEIAQLRASTIAMPLIFLAIAAGIIYIMLRRTVEQQRGQIGILMALGYTYQEVLIHYLSYAILIGMLGGLGGGIFGTALSFYFTNMYTEYFNIPGLAGKFSLNYLLIGTLLSIGFCSLAGYQGIRTVLQLPPAEAMRPAAPLTGKKIMIEKLGFLWRTLTATGKMAIRNIFRNKQRSALAVIGIAASFSMMVASKALFDSSYYLVTFQFEKVEKYDIKVQLDQLTDKFQAMAGGKSLPGIIQAEPLLEIPAAVNHKWYKKNTALIGLDSPSSLFCLVDTKGDPVEIPPGGLVISNQLAKNLSVKLGDVVNIKVLLGDDKEYLLRVTQIIPQYVGLGAYMNLDDLSEMLQERPLASSVLLKAKPEDLPQIRKTLTEADHVASIGDKTKLKAQFEELMASAMASQYILLFFAFITGFAIVYNVNLISLSERKRELATLMVIGMTEKEISRILIMEQSVLGFFSIILGLPLCYGMLYTISASASNDMYNMPLVIVPESFILGLIGTMLFLWAAQWKTAGRISNLSMLDVLKQQD